MSGDGSVAFEWGDSEQRFRLGIGELRELQDKCDAGPFVIYQRLASGTWRVDDVRETLRLGLIGGGMDHNRALGKVGKYVAPTHFLTNVVAARRILLAALFGDPDDIVGKIEAGVDRADQPAARNGRLAFSNIIGTATAIGWGVEQLNRASLWEFAAAVDGWNSCHGAEGQRPEPITPEEFDRMLERDARRQEYAAQRAAHG